MTRASYKEGIITSREVTTAQTFLIKKIAMHDKVNQNMFAKLGSVWSKRGSVACLGQAVENLQLRELDPRTPRTCDLHVRKNQISKTTLGHRTSKDTKELKPTQQEKENQEAQHVLSELLGRTCQEETRRRRPGS